MDATTRLEADYCPPLDPALLFAITSDFDLSNADDLATARQTLDELKETALIEETSTFEPSGVGIEHTSLAQDGHSSRDRSTQAGDEQRSVTTDDTSLSNDLSGLSLTNDSSNTNGSFDNYDDDTKMLLLIDVFGEQVSEQTIRTALQHSHGNWTAAMEELLNQVYFQDAEHSDTGDKSIAKGIDGFAEERVARRNKRQRNRTKRIAESVDSSADEASYPAVNKWELKAKDVDFLASRIGMSQATVSVVYNQHGAALPATINALLKEEMKNNKKSNDDDTIRLAEELRQDFPTIDKPYLLSIIRITHPSTANAHELAKALVTRPMSSGSTTIIPQYTRVSERDLNGVSQQDMAVKKHSSAISTLAPDMYAAARVQALAQANAAHRRAKSDRLMGGAAAYYGQLSRDYNGLSHAANSAAADAMAESQSTSNQVDLHGIDVLNAVRIAREKTSLWWSALGEDRANGRVGAMHRTEGFRIIVGRGTHSEGGKSKLGPAVTKMLRNEGWKFSNEGAAIAVTGKQR